MARTRGAARGRGRAKRRERPLGVAVGLGLATVLGVGMLILVVQLLLPGTTLHLFWDLVRHNSSATLPLDPLYQDWGAKIQAEDDWVVAPLSLLCGGLVLGRLAPRYASRRRVLLSGAALGLGMLAASLGFTWPAAVLQQNALDRNEGGMNVVLTAPTELIVRQALFVLGWTAFCVLGTRLGLLLRDRAPRPAAEAPSLDAARR